MKYYQLHPCDAKDPTNAKIINFINANEADAKELAAQVNVPWEFILDVAAVETGYGTAIVGYLNGVATNDYFGLHVNTATDDSHYLYQTGVYTTGTPTNPVYVAEFAAQTRFLDSGLGFVSAERPYVMNDTSPTQFALAIHAQGYGVGTPGYVWRFDSANNIIKAREDCPH